MTRVVVTGAKGQVGVDLVDVLSGRTPLGGDATFQPDDAAIRAGEFDVMGLSHRDLDVADRDAVRASFRELRPDVVVHLAAYTAVDRAEEDVVSCFYVNEQGTESVALVARDVGAHLIAISTDYVFDGTKGAAYVEDDETHPLSIYGASKRGGELHCDAHDTVVRTSWVMGVRGKNVIHAIATKANAGEHVRFVNDQMGTVTGASDLARSLATLVRARPGGTWHVANSEATTWFDIARYVGTLLGRDDEFATAIATSELSPPPLATRPQRSDLDTTKFAASFHALPPWREAVARLVRDRAVEGHVS